ncbi:MAG: thiosulfate oxidation carrier protein SoxY [Burkholderiales bacterium]|jgi:sulfur-oxidizing protein SoxY|uniref:thiosulfate oxidation carrier protein SoxY n=1 Tax=Casimicrobium huifangae TaxID=2591109 RepID=UPI0012EB5581|nr:thiosulfate oxidation carrier protein SoxY [Casimicrobium huifangae]
MNSIDTGRRQALKTGGSFAVVVAAVSAGVLPASAFADWNKAAFDAKSLNDVVKALGGSAVEKSGDIAITAPDIAENGAVVPIAVASKIAGTQSIAILVEKNPYALSAQFDIPAGTEANVGTRVKMGQSSNVHAVVKANGKYYVATKEVKVTLGGCGG